MVLSPWGRRARPPCPQLVGYVPEMNNLPPSPNRMLASSLSLLSIVQHNCLESWDVFLSLFESFKKTSMYPSVVLLQDPPVSQARLPSFNGLEQFVPPVRKPRVASYLHCSFLAKFSALPRFTEKAHLMPLDVSSQNPFFGSQVHSFRLVNASSINSADRRVHSVPPDLIFPDVGFLLLVVGDLNIHNPLSDPLLRSFSSQQICTSASCFEFAVV